MPAAIGFNAQFNQPTLNNRAGQLAVQLRDLCLAIGNLQDSVVGPGQSGLQGMGFSGPDASELLNKVSVMNTIAQIYYGNATQADPYNFDDALSELRGIM